MLIVDVSKVSVTLFSKKILDDVSFSVNANEHFAISGATGSGKTTLLHAIMGKIFHRGSITIAKDKKIVLVEQQHQFKNLSNTHTFYYQQRFNSSDAEDAQSVQDYLPLQNENKKVQSWMQTLQIDLLFHKKLIQLSNGENKRVQIAKALLEQPDILLLDNVFLGLDVHNRTLVSELLETISAGGITIILATSSATIPSFITHVIELSEGKATITKKKNFVDRSKPIQYIPIDFKLLEQLSSAYHPEPFQHAVKMNSVNVQYGDKPILHNIDWTVKKGDHWSLSGPNGAGKSTLLSLINADNPQAYANDIYLFDKKRGTGESIWDIKRKIGFVSPELHLFFDQSSTAFNVVASGLFDTVGLFRTLTEEQEKKVSDWMQLLQIHHLKHQLLRNLPTGLQRITLLARALIKNPPLLLLDEPTQGLDDEHRIFFKHLVNEICTRTEKTLIYISHYTEDIPACVTKFMVLENGQVVSTIT